jgi:hypothetical protein
VLVEERRASGWVQRDRSFEKFPQGARVRGHRDCRKRRLAPPGVIRPVRS